MEEQLLQLGLGGAGFLVLFLIVKMLVSFIDKQRQDQNAVLEKLTESIDTNTQVTKSTATVMEKHSEALSLLLQKHFQTIAGGGDEES